MEDSKQQHQLKLVLDENTILRDENARLKAVLEKHGLHLPEPVPTADRIEAAKTSTITPLSSEDKLTMFRSLFRGREDVYAVRWEGRSGKAGYSPASLMDWQAVRAARMEDRKKVTRETRTLLPLTADAIRDHLLGRHTIGLYPLLPDETCWFLAVDFDKKTWREDATAFVSTCNRFSVPTALERSRSGNGAHVWMFFDRAVAAADARRLGCAILTRTTAARHELGLDSYDRLFPNQDTLPKGGFGNLIALPLQKEPREHGNSVFLDDHLEPYPDQWQFLGSMARIPVDFLPSLIREVAPEGNVIGVKMSLMDDEEEGTNPWLLPPSRKRKGNPISEPLPTVVRAVLSDLVYIEKKGLPASMLDRLMRLAAFQNPEFYKAQAMRLSTYGKARIISCCENFPDHLGLPRGCIEEVSELFRAYGTKLNVQDERIMGKAVAVSFHANLKPEQQDAVEAILAHDNGVINAPTAFGKTVVASCLIARRAVNALILVHRRQLLDQWRERLAAFLDLSPNTIGQIGGGKTKRTGIIDVAVIQSLQRKGDIHDLIAEYGHIVVDECHHLSAFTFEQILRRAKAKYILGLTATPIRKDGHHPIIFMQCGPIRFSLSAKKAAASAPFTHTVFPRQTTFKSLAGDDASIHDIYSAITSDDTRNNQIVADIRGAVAAGRSPLVLTGRTDHLNRLAEELHQLTPHVFVLRGGMGRKQRKQIADDIAMTPLSAPRIILSTGSYIGEGFDDARLDTLFLVMPISWKGTLQQYVGRLHRLLDTKKAVQVFDYIDSQVPMLARMFKKRLAGYQAFSYTIADADQPNLP